MNQLLEDPKPKICLEIEFEDHNILQNLAFSAQTEVLGGKVTQVDFVGETFDVLDYYRKFLNEEQIAFLQARKGAISKARSVIYLALNDLIEDIEFDERVISGEQEETM